MAAFLSTPERLVISSEAAAVTRLGRLRDLAAALAVGVSVARAHQAETSRLIRERRREYASLCANSRGARAALTRARRAADS